MKYLLLSIWLSSCAPEPSVEITFREVRQEQPKSPDLKTVLQCRKTMRANRVETCIKVKMEGDDR